MDLENFADVGVADFTRIAYFRRQPLAKTDFCALECNAPIQFFVDRFIDDTHAAFGYLFHDPESAVYELPRRERMLPACCTAEWFQQKTLHPLHGLDITPDLRKQFRIFPADTSKVCLTVVPWPRER